MLIFSNKDLLKASLQQKYKTLSTLKLYLLQNLLGYIFSVPYSAYYYHCTFSLQSLPVSESGYLQYKADHLLYGCLGFLLVVGLTEEDGRHGVAVVLDSGSGQKKKRFFLTAIFETPERIKCRYFWQSISFKVKLLNKKWQSLYWKFIINISVII